MIATSLKTCLLALAMSLVVACGANPGLNLKSPQQELSESRHALEDLRGSPFAGQAGPELEAASSWLTQAETELSGEDVDESEVRMLLRLANGQLVVVKSIYSRRKAEAALERSRGEYEGHVIGIDEIESKRRQLDGTSSEALQ